MFNSLCKFKQNLLEGGAIEMAEYLSPGVFVEEFESGPRSMEGVSTSTAGFVGLTERGPSVGEPLLVTNFSDFYRKFGGYLSENEFGEYRYLSYAIEQFFVNGGSRCYVMRVVPSDAERAENAKEFIKFYAKDPGEWGNKISISITESSKSKIQVYEVIESENGKKYKVKSNAGLVEGDIVKFEEGDNVEINKVKKISGKLIEFEKEFEADVVDTNLLPQKVLKTSEFDMEVKFDNIVESYEFLSLNISATNYITKKLDKSKLIDVAVEAVNEIIEPVEVLLGAGKKEDVIDLLGGLNGTVEALSAADFIGIDNGPSRRSGIQSFIDNNEVSIMAVPGVVDLNVQLSLVAHCENMANRFAILDIPRKSKTTSDVLKHRDVFDSDYAAFYNPWLEVFDHLDKKNTFIPPSGAVAGVYSRTDQERGVHKAPANEVVRNCVGLDCNYNIGEQDILNPKGVNLIRSFTGQGIRVWGARTASSNQLWKYINVRRLFIYIEESIKRNTNWVVFEPNDELLWVRVKRTVEVFLEGVWRSGALSGNTANEAFFVNIGRNTMSEDDIANGRLICEIGIAPVKPAEFVIFRITQKTSEQ